MPSLYGKGAYGGGLYSQSSIYDLTGDLPPSLAFSGALTGGGFNIAGDLPPSVVFSATLTGAVTFAGDLSPSVAFSASLQRFVDLGPANLAVAPAINGVLGLLLVEHGNMSTNVVLAGAITAGPLWQESELCEADWQPAELCDG